MQKIFRLPDSLVSQIAAGEIIERPSYVVKELVENALDAKATDIQIHIQDGGSGKVQAIDNGEGMSREDLKLCFFSHTTSKIRAEDGLFAIQTLGFRGEALASIAAVAFLTIITRTKDSLSGTLIEVRSGQLENISSIGSDVGTIVTVENLFSKVPARKKFLKSSQTELRHITDVLIHFALSYPKVRFVFTSNKKTVFDLSATDDLLFRIDYLLGKTVSENMVPLEYEEGYVKITGFLGKPQIATKYNQKQYLFVNNRFVSDRLISLAIKESYGTLLPVSSTPVLLLSLTLPFEAVDVNIHPRKEQVHFVDAKMIFDALKQAVSQTLAENNLLFNFAKFKKETSAKMAETQTYSSIRLKEKVVSWQKSTITGENKSFALQIYKSFLLTTGKAGLVLIDQHAAHERVLYEEFLEAFLNEKNKKRNYSLIKPLPVHLSLSELQILKEHLDEFTAIGFEIEHFQGNSFVIRTAPLVFKGRDLEKIILDMILDLGTIGAVKTFDDRTKRMLTFLSCRLAVKAGDELSEGQATDLFKKLKTTLNNLTCPHGRPISLSVSLSDLNRYFKRT